MSLSREPNQTIARVMEFSIDPPGKALRFVDRLARENGWSLKYAERVIDEYKRFCILALEAGHPVTPSHAVDQAWHLHLTYTRCYWDRFCGECLGQPLHHEPTAGGLAEGVKFHDWYSATLDSYRRIFEREPPSDIWPNSQQRFRNAADWKWVNGADVWMLPKRPWKRLGLSAVALVLVLIVAGCQPFVWKADMAVPELFLGWLPNLKIGASEFLIGYMLLVAVVVMVILAARTRQTQSEFESGNDANASWDQLSVEELAVLAGGASRMIQATISGLYADGHLTIDQNMQSPGRLKVVGDGPVEPGLPRELFIAIRDAKSSELAAVARPYYDRAVANLEDMNLRHPSQWYSKPGLFMMIAILVLGGLRMVQGILTGRPVGDLLVVMILFGIAALLLNVRLKFATQKGIELLNQARSKREARFVHQVADSSHGADHADPASGLISMNVALLGLSALAQNPELAPLEKELKTMTVEPTAAPWTSGCGAGCGDASGGGGCGGGGGGCGGGGCGGCGG